MKRDSEQRNRFENSLEKETLPWAAFAKPGAGKYNPRTIGRVSGERGMLVLGSVSRHLNSVCAMVVLT